MPDFAWKIMNNEFEVGKQSTWIALDRLSRLKPGQANASYDRRLRTMQSSSWS